MYSKELCEYINETSNKFWNLFDDKGNQYNYLYNLIPKLKYRKINYLKKIIPEFYSQREYKRLVELEKEISK
jgi:hypothetical protein